MDAAILRFFESIRCTALTWTFGIFSALGEAAVISVIIIMLYWMFGRAGEQLLFTLLSSAAFNGLLKCAVSRPRPYAAGVVTREEVELPILDTVNLADNLSFPSGHAQATSSGVFAGAFRLKKWWMWTVAVLFTLLVCCSRLYFGVHYPTDVLTGALFGVLFALFWQLIFKDAYAYRYYILIGMAIVILLLLPLAPVHDFLQVAGLLAGGAVFLPLASFLKYEGKTKGWKRLLRIPVGLIGVGMVYLVTLFFPEDAGFTLLKWFLLTGAATFLAQLLFKVLKI